MSKQVSGNSAALREALKGFLVGGCVHPAFDGGSYVGCNKCRYSYQAKTWAPTYAEAAKKWNKMERNRS